MRCKDMIESHFRYGSDLGAFPAYSRMSLSTMGAKGFGS
jgi:hypothetical protein